MQPGAINEKFGFFSYVATWFGLLQFSNNLWAIFKEKKWNARLKELSASTVKIGSGS